MRKSKMSNEYYNNAWKIQFINGYNGKIADSYWIHLFGKSKITEESLDKDLCDFTLDDIIALLKSYRSASVTALGVKASILRTYTTWCIRNDKSESNFNHFDEINHDLLNECVDRHSAMSRLTTQKELYSTLEDILNPKDQFLVLAVYEGVCGGKIERLIPLTLEDVYENYIIIEGKEKPISQKLRQIAEASATTYEYYRGDKDGGKIKKSILEDKPTIIKRFISKQNENKGINARALFRRLDNLNAAHDALLSFNALRYSGFIKQFYDIVDKNGKGFLANYESTIFQELVNRYELRVPRVQAYQLYNDYKSVIETESLNN